MFGEKMLRLRNIKDIISIICLRIKMLFSNRKLIGVYIGILILTIGIMLTYDEAAEDKSSIPIGIVDLDNTTVTRSIIDEINNSNIIRVETGSKKELFQLLKDNKIYSIFVYEKGFTDKLFNLDTDEIIKDYYPKNNNVSKVISDVVLAGMLDEICYTYCNKTYYKNTKLYTKTFSNDEYSKYIKKLYSDEAKTIAFNFYLKSDESQNYNSKNNVNNNKNNNVNNNNNNNNNNKQATAEIDKKTNQLNMVLLYKEIVFAVTCLISVIVAMIFGNIFIDDRRVGADKRFILSKIHTSSLVIGDSLSMMIISNIFAFIVSGILVSKLHIVRTDEFLKFVLIIFLFECTISMLFVLLTRILRDIVAYQLIGSIFVLFIGISGAVYLLGFLLNDSLSKIASYMPMGMLIDGYNNIIMGERISDNVIIYVIYICIMLCMTYIFEYMNENILEDR
ncbi:MAG: ABC transporter permease [Lachnospiraceae bacterium]|nr:ABC transporter permease [Lachnospiraceae bacterium]